MKARPPGGAGADAASPAEKGHTAALRRASEIGAYARQLRPRKEPKAPAGADAGTTVSIARSAARTAARDFRGDFPTVAVYRCSSERNDRDAAPHSTRVRLISGGRKGLERHLQTDNSSDNGLTTLFFNSPAPERPRHRHPRPAERKQAGAPPAGREEPGDGALPLKRLDNRAERDAAKPRTAIPRRATNGGHFFSWI